MNRRNLLKGIGLGALGAMSLPTGAQEASDKRYTDATKGLRPLKITKVRAITTSPMGARLVIIKVETDEPGLYGLGCGTYNQRPLTVVTAVNEYLDGFARGRSVDDIEDMWQNAYTSSYWRNGPVLNNALSGLDMALWDIKGKRANMPVYQLLGGRSRFAADCYSHAGGRDFKELEDSVLEDGTRLSARTHSAGKLWILPSFSETPFSRSRLWGPVRWSHGFSSLSQGHPKMFEHIRNTCGEDVELLHDVHERIQPIEASTCSRNLSSIDFFIEDPLAPEQNGYFPQLRNQTSVPIAMGELFNNPHEWVDLITNRLIDFIRVHITQAGGFTPSRKLATLGEWFGVRTAWHGPETFPQWATLPMPTWT